MGKSRGSSTPNQGKTVAVEGLERRLLLSSAVRTAVANLTGPVLSAEMRIPATAVLPQKWFSNQKGSHYLTRPSSDSPATIALFYLRAHASDFGVSVGDLSDLVETDYYTDVDTGVTHLYFRQRYQGVEVSGADVSVHLSRDGRVIFAGGSLIKDLANKASAAQAAARVPAVFRAPYSDFAAASSGPGSHLLSLGADQAVLDAASYLGLSPQSSLVYTQIPGKHQLAGDSQLMAPGISLDAIPARLQYVFTSNLNLRLAWNLILKTPTGHWYDLNVDGQNGSLLAAQDWADGAKLSDSYNVFSAPIENPADGARSVVQGPADPAASPFGWHDANGAAGSEYTDTRGNNVFAQEDADANNTGGYRPAASVDAGSGALTFDFPLDLSQPPATYRDASITNVFYWANLLHDVQSRYGFNEAAGNFQVVNYSGAGISGDPVLADVQDGGGSNDSSFATPPDGYSPRMQLYLFNKTSPGRDSALDGQIIAHEYGHGVSTRLTGGPANSDSLTSLQSRAMGEGWSDWWALMFTLKPTDTKSGRYAIGTYELGQDAATGSGIRNYPYSFDLGVDPLTYRTLSSSNNLYDRGQVWGSALMDLTWLLIDKYGYRSDWQHGYEAANPARNGGNNLVMKLVMDALKLQPANPSFLAGRDAILAADAALTGGANALAIWTAFARRGMGYLASSLGTSNDTQISESFDLPPTLILPKIVSQVPNANSAISAPVSQIDFSFLESMDPSSFSIADDVVSFVSPSGADLKSQITGFTWLNSSLTLRIYFNSQSADGLYQMVIGPNILAADDHSPMDQDGDHVAGEAGDDAYTAKFRIDTLPLAVVNTTPANGSLITLPLTSLDIDFNEPIDPASLQTSDLTISRGSVSGVSALDSNTARFILSGISGESNLTFTLKSGSVADVNGGVNPAAASGTLSLDNGMVPFPGTFAPVAPAGSLVYSGSASTTISLSSDVDTFTLHLLSGQTLRAALSGTGSLTSKMEIRNSQADLLSTVAQGSISPLLNVAADDTYSFAISSTSGTGNATLTITLNQSDEVEPNSASAPQDIDGLFQPVAPGSPVQRVAIGGMLGSATDTQDAYSFHLSAGQSLSALFLTPGLQGNPPLILKASDGTVMAYGSSNGASVNSVIADFVAPFSDNYELQFGINNGNRAYNLILTRDGGLEVESNDSMDAANFIASHGLGASASRFVVGNITAGNVDYYKLAVKAGDSLRFQTTTPGDATVPAINAFDPRLTLYGADQTLIATDDNSAGDGRNALIQYTAPSDGLIYVQVSGAATSGASALGNYLLEAAGSTAQASAPTITFSPSNGARFNVAPATVSVNFSEPILGSSVSASDLLIDGVPATAATLAPSNARQIVFTLPTGLAEGNHTLTVAAGAILDIHGTPVAAATSNFVLDQTGPRIVFSSIQEKDTIPTFSDVVLQLQFDEPIDLIYFRNNNNISDTLFKNATQHGVPDRNYTYNYDPISYKLTFTFPSPVDGYYTFLLPSNMIVDQAGNGMDGEPLAFPIPGNRTGNGVPGGDFTLHMYVDSVSVALLTPTPVGPPGAQIYETAAPLNLHSGADVDSFTIKLQAGQYLSLRDEPSSGLLWPHIAVKDPANRIIASGSGIGAQTGLSINAIPIDIPGIYTITGSMQGGSDANIGSSTLYVTINGLCATNSAYLTTPITPANARSSNPIPTFSGRSLSGANSTALRFDLAAGDYADVLSSDASGLLIYQVNGTTETLVATGLNADGGVSYVKNLHTDTARTYIARGFGSAYGIAVVRNAGFEIEDNNTNAQANRIESPLVAGERAMVGYISAGGDQDRYALNVSPGQSLTFRTTTPGDTAGFFDDALDTKLSLYDASGNLLVSDDNSGGDHRNARLLYTATATATLYLAVSASPDASGSAAQGEYVLGTTATDTFPFTASVVNPPNGSAVVTPVSTVSIAFNDDVNVASVTAADLQIDGTPATAFRLVDSRSIDFTVPALGQGGHTLTIAAGAILDTQNTPVEPLASTFTLDTVRPTITSSTLQNGQILPAGDLTFKINLSERVDPTAIQREFITMRGANRAANYYPESVTLDAAGTAMTFFYRGLPDDAYTFSLPAGEVQDIAGSTMLSTFTLSFFVDASTPQPFGQLSADPVAGPFVYRGTTAAALFDATDTDSFALPLDPGQVMDVRLNTNGNFVGSLDILDPNGASIGTFTASSAAGILTANSVQVAAGGGYRLIVSAMGGGSVGNGGYSLSVDLGSIRENESISGPSNDTPATAQPLSLMPPPGVSSTGADAIDVTRAAVTGSLEDFFLANFEDGLDGFTLDNSPASGLWHLTTSLGTNTGHSATHSLYYGHNEGDNALGNYDTGSANAGNVLSPLIALPSGSSLSLSFAYLLVTDRSKDKAILQISTNNGATFTDLATYGGTAESSSWKTSSAVSLSAYAGQVVQFRWLFDTVDASNNNFAGWYVDDVKISGNVTAPDYYSVALSAGDRFRTTLSLSTADSLQLSLLDSNGYTLTSNSTSGSGKATINTVPIPADGLYYLRVSGNTKVAYNLNLTRNAVSETEPNNSPHQATFLSRSFLGENAIGAISASTSLQTVFSDTFEGTTLPTPTTPPPLSSAWATYSSRAQGVVRVGSDQSAAGGQYALLMEGADDGVPTLNEATLSVDLTDVTGAALTFAQANFGDEITTLPTDFAGHFNGDGVSISDDGIRWHRVWTPTSSDPLGAWTTVSIDLAAQAAAAGMRLGPNFKIRFQQYDDSSFAGGDGRGFDSVVVAAAIPEPDYYSLDVSQGEIVTLSTSTPGDFPSAQPENHLDPRIEVFGPSSQFIAADSNSAADGRNAQLTFTSSAVGRYIIKVTGESLAVGDYILSLSLGNDYPKPGTPDLAPQSDTGIFQEDNRTSLNDSAPGKTLVFTVPNVEVGATVTLSIDGVALPSIVAGSSTITFTTPGNLMLADGSHIATATEQRAGDPRIGTSFNLNFVVDATTDAVPSVPVLQQASDTGLPGDGVTAVRTPAFNISTSGQPYFRAYLDGVRLPGDYLSGTQLVLQPLDLGSYTLTISGVDAAGNESAQSLGFNLHVVSTAPPPPTDAPDLDHASDSGFSNGDKITSVKSPTILLPAGLAGFRLFVNGTPTSSVPSTGTSYLLSNLADGNYNIAYTAFDAAGSESALSPKIIITIDTTPPTQPPGAPDLVASSDLGISSTDNITSDNTPTFSFTGAPYYRLYRDGLLISPLFVSGNFTSGVVPDGTSIYQAAAVDAAGNVSSLSPTLTVVTKTVIPATPTVAPDLDSASDTGISDSDNITMVKTPTLILPSGPGYYTIYRDGNPIGGYIDGGGAIPLANQPEETHVYTYTVSDDAGNESAKSPPLSIRYVYAFYGGANSVGIDLLPESDTGTADNDNHTSDNTPTFDTYILSPNYYRITRTPGNVQVSGMYDTAPSFTSEPLPDGSYTFLIQAINAAGNLGPTDIQTVYIDTVAPSSSIAPLPALTTSGSISLVWSGKDPVLDTLGTPGSGIAVYDIYVSDNGGPFTPWLSNTITTSATYPAVPQHRYAFYSIAHDKAGNVEAPPGNADAVTVVGSTTQDIVPPTVVKAAFDKPGNIEPVPAGAHYISVQFSEDMRAPIAPSWIHIRNLTLSLDVTPAAVTYDPSTHIAVITFAEGSLLDGDYLLTLPSSDFGDIVGNPLDGDGNGQPGGDFTFAFYRLRGDANGDRSVNQADHDLVAAAQGQRGITAAFADINDDGTVSFADLVAVAQNYGSSNASRSQGDINGDAAVGFADLVAIAQNYGAVPAADLNRDGLVNAADLAIADSNSGHSLPASAPPLASSIPAAASSPDQPPAAPPVPGSASQAERAVAAGGASKPRTYSVHKIISDHEEPRRSAKHPPSGVFATSRLDTESTPD